MSRCEIAALWHSDRRMKKEEEQEKDGGGGEHREQTGSIELSRLSPCRENNPAGAH